MIYFASLTNKLFYVSSVNSLPSNSAMSIINLIVTINIKWLIVINQLSKLNYSLFLLQYHQFVSSIFNFPISAVKFLVAVAVETSFSI